MTEALVISQILLWICMGAVILIMAAMLRQLGVLFERVAPAGALAMNSRLEAGDTAPKFSLSALDESIVEIGGPSQDQRNTLLFFLSGDCPICKELMPALRSFELDERSDTRVVYVGSAQEQNHNAIASERRIPFGSYVVSDDVGMTYAVSKLPYAVLIDESGKIVSFGLVNNREHLESMVIAQEQQVSSIQDYLKKSA